ncbi:Fe-S cluster assembly protein SufD [Rhodomicrobium vannielii ATCC 17100]|uniref:Fe-S cluster assembly protein SufD n=1 Tax=Rhodomicrobium vannielii TaxID=1069 RepID=UPI001919C019|nr:Fe-S cluster assembly protein SufD [Rhodomicrobium vannielii]MBJ7535113.1 Fe-S cluster assembly protein SufD [Rhodomicrobium vannielii ATCC 17100]
MTIHQTITAAATPAEQRFLDLYASACDRLPGAGVPAVRAWREEALDAFAALGVPHRRVEAWKYTDLRALMTAVHPLGGLDAGAQADVDASIGRALANIDSYRAVFAGGKFRPDLSTIQGAPGISFTPLCAKLKSEADAAATLAALPLPKGDVVAALSTAFATSGALISIAPGKKIDKPIHLIVIASSEANAYALRHAIKLGDGAEASIIETHVGAGASQAWSYTALDIGKGAALKHARLTQSAAALHLASATVTLGERAVYEPTHAAIGGALTRSEGTIHFTGPNARATYNAAILARGHSHVDFTLVVDHAAPHCESRELVKAVLDDRAKGVFQGKVAVQRGAQKTDGKQMANALLLSNDAEFDSKPELEIFADDVVCGHGATAGQLDEDLMFYLRARGIPEAQARALLIAAFVGAALDTVDNEGLHTALVEKVAAWLAAK